MQARRLASTVTVALTLVMTVASDGSQWGAPLRAQALEADVARVELGLVLRQLNSAGTFMMATAHPDDENNALLALLAKGQGHRTVLLTATRGDGGQNGRVADRGVAGGAPSRRGRAVFHAGR